MTKEQGNFVGAIITDCKDPNAVGRQCIEFQRIFGITPTIIGVEHSLEVGGNLVDLLDRLKNGPLAVPGQRGVLLGNAAPRSGEVKKKWKNGTPFCFFKVGEILVVTTFEAQSLALLRDQGIVEEVKILDVPTITKLATEWSDLTPKQAAQIRNTQFRSLEFLQVAAKWLYDGRQIPFTTYTLSDLPKVHNLVWKVDNFGNAKTTLTENSIKLTEGETVELADGAKAIRYKRLTDVGDGETAITTGSSGFGDTRFLEIAIGGKGNAAFIHGLIVGSKVLRGIVVD